MIILVGIGSAHLYGSVTAAAGTSARSIYRQTADCGCARRTDTTRAPPARDARQSQNRCPPLVNAGLSGWREAAGGPAGRRVERSQVALLRVPSRGTRPTRASRLYKAQHRTPPADQHARGGGLRRVRCRTARRDTGRHRILTTRGAVC